jgi:citrate synthase
MAAPADLMSSDAARWAATLDIVAKVPSIIAAFHRIRSGDEPAVAPDHLGHAAAFLYGITGAEPDPLAARVMDVALVLHAEHGFNASTFSARVTGSTLSDPYAVTAAAVSTLAGKLHGGANEDVLRTLESIGDADPAAWAAEQVAARSKIPGFGHRVYKVKDPRAGILQGLAARVFEKLGSTPLYDRAIALEAAMEGLVGSKGIYPNVDFYSGIVYQKLDIPSDLFTPIFAVARTAGWLAHWTEQLAGNRIFRPTQIYEGDRDVAFTPIEDRG